MSAHLDFKEAHILKWPISTMDTSTIVFILVLLVAFLFLRWLISPIPQSVPDEFNVHTSVGQPENHTNNHVPAARQRRRREVTDSMVEVVRAIAPQLTEQQIRFSLERTGSVEATVDEYMENLSLPFPPGHDAEDNAHNVAPEGGAKTLLEKYNIEVLADADETDAKWGQDESERLALLQRRREEMILRARRRLEKSLANDVIGD